MEQNMNSRNRYTTICGILEKVALQIYGEKVQYLINSIEKNGPERKRGKIKPDSVPDT